ncbi:hypothetical protein Pmani_011808 [Petrolisthes manimaculis]|uniref:Uncharacterized protein n=1 Tax=Petrolisthes manimaculis TaxID=1843537 RepID=A0AAE1PYI5_9EUCA|nr:hypothetical protein Pmani_011808 [Petrolisthes manimaculis]
MLLPASATCLPLFLLVVSTPTTVPSVYPGLLNISASYLYLLSSSVPAISILCPLPRKPTACLSFCPFPPRSCCLHHLCLPGAFIFVTSNLGTTQFPAFIPASSLPRLVQHISTECLSLLPACPKMVLTLCLPIPVLVTLDFATPPWPHPPHALVLTPARSMSALYPVITHLCLSYLL